MREIVGKRKIEQALDRLKALKGENGPEYGTISIACRVRKDLKHSRKGVLISLPKRNDKSGPARWTKGDFVQVTITVERDGYLHLFCLGTDGRTILLFPGIEERNDNRVERGQEYSFPGELFSVEQMGGPGFIEEGPATSSTGLPERIVAIITEDDIHLLPERLHENFQPVALAKGVPDWEEASSGIVESIEDLDSDTWTWGLFEVEVI